MFTGFDYQSKRISYNGSEIQTYSFGNGKQQIFSFPSFPHSGLYYLFFTKYYPRNNYRFITFDLPGWTGWSDNIWKDSTFSMDVCVDIAQEVLDSYGVKDTYNIIGYSFGTALATRLAVRNSEQVKKVVLVSPLIDGETAKQESLSKWIRLAKRAHAAAILKYIIVQRTKARTDELSSELSQPLLYLYNSMVSNSNSKVLLDSVYQLFTNNDRANIAKLNEIEQLMIVNSQTEDHIFRRQAEFLRRHLNSEKSLKISGTHDEFILHPKSTTVRQVMDFLT